MSVAAAARRKRRRSPRRSSPALTTSSFCRVRQSACKSRSGSFPSRGCSAARSFSSRRSTTASPRSPARPAPWTPRRAPASCSARSTSPSTRSSPRGKIRASRPIKAARTAPARKASPDAKQKAQLFGSTTQKTNAPRQSFFAPDCADFSCVTQSSAAKNPLVWNEKSSVCGAARKSPLESQRAFFIVFLRGPAFLAVLFAFQSVI